MEHIVFPQKDAENGSQSLWGAKSQTKGLGGPLLTFESKAPESFYKVHQISKDLGNLKILRKIRLVKSWEFWRVP